MFHLEPTTIFLKVTKYRNRTARQRGFVISMKYSPENIFSDSMKTKESEKLNIRKNIPI